MRDDGSSSNMRMYDSLRFFEHLVHVPEVPRPQHHFYHPLLGRGGHLGESQGGLSPWTRASGWNLQGAETEAPWDGVAG